MKLILNKILSIGQIIVDYIVDFFNRNSRDYRKVSEKLAKMKSEDKAYQRERMRMETSIEQVDLFFKPK